MISGRFHLRDGHLESRGGNVVVGGVIGGWMMMELMGEEEEALEVGFGVGGIAGDVGFEVKCGRHGFIFSLVPCFS